MTRIQPANTVLMIRPTNFGFNAETAESNSFQDEPLADESAEIQAKALEEFEQFALELTSLGIEVAIYDDFEDSITPDSIFPNNWFSTHSNGQLVIYPMAAPNRRKERRSDIIISLKERFNYRIEDFTSYETENPPKFLEGTGSLIFDHQNKVVYAALSARTARYLVEKVSSILGYDNVCFNAIGKQGEPIYHTNVMMSIGDNFILIGLDTVLPEDLPALLHMLNNSGKKIVPLTNQQVYDQFAGNALQIANKKGEKVLVISRKALEGLSGEQLNDLKEMNDHILPISIPTIERIGGGSVRCMLAEIFN